MAREKTLYTCTECGGTSPKWLGKCPHCGAWNTLQEGVAEAPGKQQHRFQALAATAPVTTLADIDATEIERTPTGIDELDRVLGGGIVPGGVVLIGGDPGIGKSTLLLQAMDLLTNRAEPVAALYVTGEESGAQIALRSRRLGVAGSRLRVLAEINLERILAAIDAEQPAVVVIDSIQTLYSEQLTSAPGSVAQVRECAAQLTRTAKATGVDHRARRPRHQGGHARRAARARAHRRHGALFRGRHAQRASAWCARSRTATARSARSASSR